jgi:hypothetical protein
MAHDQEIVGSNPGTVYWMDVSDASYYIIEKLKIKVAKWGTPKKKNNNNVQTCTPQEARLPDDTGLPD